MDKWLLFTINLPKLAILRKVVDFVIAQKILSNCLQKEAWDGNNAAKIL